MNLVPDDTGTFVKRPRYRREELEAKCENVMGSFLHKCYGNGDRIATEDDLTTLLESLGALLDTDADLSSLDSAENGWTQGLTDWVDWITGRPDPRPRVYIRRGLREQRFYRYLMTLAHETSHVLCEMPAWNLAGNLIGKESRSLRCRGAQSFDWKDWRERQAGYCGLALLMRIRMLELRLGPRPEKSQRPSSDALQGQRLIHRVSEEFVVSFAAARCRLESIGYLTSTSQQLNLRLGVPAIAMH